jgi:UDP-N-acetylglucosamine acyltransferase
MITHQRSSSTIHISSPPMTTLIHPTAVIDPRAELHPTVQVGAYAVIGGRVSIGAGTIVGHHAIIEGWVEIGERNEIFPGAAIGLASQDMKYDGSNSLVRIGNDNRIREYVTINRANYENEATVIGNGNLLLAYVHVGHDCIIEDNVVITNAVSIGGHVYIESRARIGGMVGIHQFVHIGRLAMVGAMSRIDRDVPPYMLVEGNPSRIRTLNLVGLKRAGIADLEAGQVLQLLKKAFRLLYRSELTFRDAVEQLGHLAENDYLQHLYKFLLLSQSDGRRGLVPGRRGSQEDE